MIIYVLKLLQNKYYIDATNNLDMIIENHRTFNFCEWTTKYPPIKVLHTKTLNDNSLEPIDCISFEQYVKLEVDKYVKMYMIKYGVDNIRGGTYSNSLDTNKIVYNQFNQFRQINIYEELLTKISKIFYKEYIDISIDLLPFIEIADNYYQTCYELENKKIVSPIPETFVADNNKLVDMYKEYLDLGFNNDIKLLSTQIINIYNYITHNNLIDSNEIVMMPYIKLMFYQILDVINNTNIEHYNIVKEWGDKQIIYNKCIDKYN